MMRIVNGRRKTQYAQDHKIQVVLKTTTPNTIEGPRKSETAD